MAPQYWRGLRSHMAPDEARQSNLSPSDEKRAELFSIANKASQRLAWIHSRGT